MCKAWGIMKIQPILSQHNKNNSKQLSFGRLLTQNELEEYKSTLKEAKAAVGNDGKSVFIVHDACLPQSADTNTGVGNLSAKKSLQFFDFIKNYLGINSVEILPAGECMPYQKGTFFCAYHSSAFSLSPHQINLELLTMPEYSSLITQDDIKTVVDANTMPKKETLANFENVVNENSSFDEVIKKAFDNFRQKKDLNLSKEFEEYKLANEDWLKPKVLFKVLKQKNGTGVWRNWIQEDRELFVDIDDAKQARISQLLADNSEELEYYSFKQFLADKHLAHSKKSLNERGLKLIGDCLIGFSEDEVWANQKAFNLDSSVGWGLPSLDYETITKEGSAAEKLLKRKVQLFAQRYDSIRFDVSWAYIEPKLSPRDWKNGSKHLKRTDFGSVILDRIDDYVREIKGKDFDTKELIHEFDASPEDFRMLEETAGGQIWREPMMERTKALGTTYMSSSWGNNQHFLALNRGTSNFLLGAGNHDPQPLRQIAYAVPDIYGDVYKPAQVEYLSSLFKIDKKLLESPTEFIKAKFAEVFTAKNNQYFYIDVFGREERFDAQCNNSAENYRYKIPENFEAAYIREVEQGHALNPMDALEKVFKLKGLNKTKAALYAQIVKFRDILQTPDVRAISNINTKFPLAGTIIGIITATAGGVGYYFFNKNEKNNESLRD